MSRLQATLLLALTTLAAVVLGQLAWGFFVLRVSAFIAAVPSLIGAVPAWVWWAAFGVVMSLECSVGRRGFSGSCRKLSRAACERPKSTA